MTREKEFAGKHVLITGGMGFIGSNLAIRLAGLGAKVLVVDSMIPDYGGNMFNVEPVKDIITVNISDVREIHAMHYLVQDQDILFNLAGQVSHTDSMTDPFTDLEINVRAQLAIAEACRRFNPTIRIVHTSTRQQYGRPMYLPVDEQHLVHPTDVNGIHKAAGEMYFMVYHAVYGLKATSLRLTNTYGPRQIIKNDRHGFMGWFLRKALLGEEILLYGDGSQLRDLCFVDDAVEALLTTAMSDAAIGQIFNVGGLRPISLREIAEIMIEIMGKGTCRVEPFPPNLKPIDIGDFYADYTKIKKALGWEPKVDVREGLERTLAYYQANMENYL
jgi:UDP-glucose 4-epimerase